MARGAAKQPHERVPRKDRRGVSAVKVGAIVLAVILVLTYFGFAKDIPFTKGYRLKAIVTTTNSIRKSSPVRIAGVNVGKVVGAEPAQDGHASILELQLDDKALPIHKDATLKIRPRIFLEGNYFVDLKPGTPSAPKLESGDTIPISQTAAPVQFLDVVTALQADTRKSLQVTLQNLGDALTRKPTPADDRDADPSARGQTAAESLNDAIDYGEAAFKNTAIVTEALTGTQSGDVARLLRGLSRTTAGLSRDEASLQDLITNFNTTMAATASQATNLRASIRLLAPTLESADGALDSLNAAFPNTRAFAREILPGVRETNATIQAAFPWIRQVRPLVSKAELGGVVDALSPAVRNLSAVVSTTKRLLPQADLVAKCVARVVLPAGDIKIQDGNLTTGVENYKEFWYAMVGLAGESQNFDGNGQYVRLQVGGGPTSIGLDVAPGQRFFGSAAAPPLGTRPRFPGKKPPYNSKKPCYTNALPDINGAQTGPSDSAGVPQAPPTPAAPTAPAATGAAAAAATATGAGG